jgi:hypothetical protein
MDTSQIARTLEDITALLTEAARISNHRSFVIAGSLCALGAVMQPPRDMVVSRDVDMYPKLDPGRGFISKAVKLRPSGRRCKAAALALPCVTG